MVKLTFYGGVNEVGGNKILLEDGKAKIVLDFGQSFTFGADYFTGYLAARSVNGLGDCFEFDLLPKIKGLYSREQLAFTDLEYVEPEVDAVFLSHAHFDHVMHIQFLDPEIPVYLGVGTKLFMESALLTIVVATAGLTAVGLAIGSFMTSPEGFQLITTFVIFPLFFLSGALYPLANLNIYLAVLNGINPLTYIVDTLRGIFIGVQYFGTVENIVVTVGFAAIANLIGIQAFKRMRA